MIFGNSFRFGLLVTAFFCAALLGLALHAYDHSPIGLTVLAKFSAFPLILAVAVSLVGSACPSMGALRLAAWSLAALFAASAGFDIYAMAVAHLWIEAPASCGPSSSLADVAAAVGGLHRARCDYGWDGPGGRLPLWNGAASLLLLAFWAGPLRRPGDGGGAAFGLGLAGTVAALAAGAAGIAHLALPATVPMPSAQADERSLGKAGAPIVVTEYMSLACPHCAAWQARVFPRLRRDWIDTGRVRFVLRDYPHTAAALTAAMVARCADRGRYFAVVESMMAARSEWVHADDPAAVLIRLAGLPESRVRSCLADAALRNAILASRLQGERAGIRHVPTVVVAGDNELDPGYDTLVRRLEQATGHR